MQSTVSKLAPLSSLTLRLFPATGQRLERKQPTRKQTPQEIARKMEKDIHRLMEESAQLIDNDPFLALEKAKEAVKKDTTLTKHREDNSLSMQQGNDLTFATQFHLAVAYEKNDMLHEAIGTYSFLLKQKRYEACTGRIRINMGNVYYAQQNHTQAIKMYRMALDHTTREEKALRFRIHRTIGNIFVEIGKLRDAILDYEAVSMNADADMETCFNLLLCYAQIGDVEKTKQTFLRMLSIAKAVQSNVATNQEIGNESAAELRLHQELGQAQKDLFSFLLTAARLVCSMDHDDDWKTGYQWVQDQMNDKNDEIAHQIEMEQALQYLRKSDFTSAIKILKSYESKDVDMKAMVAINLSFVYFLEGNHSVADEYADIALASNRFNPNALVNKGNSLFVKEHFAEAKELYLEAIGVDSANFEAIYNLGLANVRLGLISEAVQAFEKLHSVTTNDPRVLYHVANLYEQSDNMPSAIKWFNVLAACLPTDPGVLHRIGNLYSEQDDDTQSFHYHLESHRLYPSNLDVIGWLAIWFVKHEMYEKSIHFFKLASQIQPNEVKWCFMIASCYRKMGKSMAAFDIYEQVRKTHPEDIECKFLPRTITLLPTELMIRICT